MKKFEDKLITEFENFEISRFGVSYIPPKVFLCGGEVDIKAQIPKSLRDRLINHFAIHDEEISNSCIQAENFKDYFREGAYHDLLEFEADIAGIATLIIVCLESPGSLVELGMFCMDSSIIGKLLVVAPIEETQGEDSFIFLGPLEYIKRLDRGSVLEYPWPDKNVLEYEHLPMLVADIKTRLQDMQKTQKFSEENSSHIALLIHDVIMLASPVTLTEIEYALLAFGLTVEQKKVTRLLYLLEKIGLIAHTSYGNVIYYFDLHGSTRRVKFGLDMKGRRRDSQSMILAFRGVYISSDDEQSKRRLLAAQHVKKLKDQMK
jgi:hypothetical protein